MNPQWVFVYPYYDDPWVWVAVAVCAVVGVLSIEICNR